MWRPDPPAHRPGRADRGHRARHEGPADRSHPSADIGPARRARYARWDGSQRLPDLDADEIMDALADDVMADGDIGEALRRLLERGWRRGEHDPDRPDLPGLRDLMDRLSRRREAIREQYGLDDVLGDVRRELESIVEEERTGVERRLEAPEAPDAEVAAMAREVAARRLERLDALPRDIGDRIRGLREYDFLEPGARQRFDDLVERLGRQVLDQVAQGMGDAIRSVTPEDLQANREMVRDLNALLRERIGGGDPDVGEFLARHGRFFPGARTLDDIIEQLAERMAAMQSLLRSLRPEQRAELQSLMDALLRDDRLVLDLAELASHLDLMLPGGLGDRVPFSGAEPLTFEGAIAQLARLAAMERLEDTLMDVEHPSDLGAIDRAEVRDFLGDDGVRELDALDDLARRLEEAGYLTSDGDRLELTPRGMRRIGQKVLDDLFGRLRRDAFGGHRLERTGRGGERLETSKPYEFGDPFHLDLRATLDNALIRDENRPAVRRSRVAAGEGDPGIRLDPSDFEVFGTEASTRTATVLLVDMSRSMLLRGCFLAAKQVAVALDTLIRTQYPRDHLSVIGFAYYAREIRPGSLAALTWHGHEYGTNLQHALMLARRILARQGAANREIVVITDGEPTAHLEGGQVEFSYPPTRQTITQTLLEVQRCTRDGITINTFMLERSRALAEFVAHMTRLNRGRAFYATPEHLGEYVLVDFVGRRTGRVS